jgi:glycosyltransferase involved in cell wall biosynthesis
MRIAIGTDIYLPQLSGVADSISLTKAELEKRGHQVLVYGPTSARSFSVPGWDDSMMLALPFGIVKQLRKFKPDIIHVHTFAPIGLAALYAGWRLGVPVVGTNHTFPADYLRFFGLDYAPLRYFLRRTNAWFYNRCAYLTAPSQKIIAEMRAYHCSRPAIVLSNPIPLDLFRPLVDRQKLKAKYNLGEKVVLLFGRLGPDKNLDFALEIFAEVHQRTGAELLIVGDGPSRTHLEILVQKLKLASSVRFAGLLRGESLVEAINAAEIYLITSTESQSMTNLQAMACGLSAVGPAVGGLPEYLKNGENGFLVPPTDQPAFVWAVVDLLGDQEKRARFGQAARTSVIPFSVETIVDRIEKIYESQLSHSGL